MEQIYWLNKLFSAAGVQIVSANDVWSVLLSTFIFNILKGHPVEVTCIPDVWESVDETVSLLNLDTWPENQKIVIINLSFGKSAQKTQEFHNIIKSHGHEIEYFFSINPEGNMTYAAVTIPLAFNDCNDYILKNLGKYNNDTHTNRIFESLIRPENEYPNCFVKDILLVGKDISSRLRRFVHAFSSRENESELEALKKEIHQDELDNNKLILGTLRRQNYGSKRVFAEVDVNGMAYHNPDLFHKLISSNADCLFLLFRGIFFNGVLCTKIYVNNTLINLGKNLAGEGIELLDSGYDVAVFDCKFEPKAIQILSQKPCLII